MLMQSFLHNMMSTRILVTSFSSIRLVSRSSYGHQKMLFSSRKKGREPDMDYDPHYNDYAARNYNKTVSGHYDLDYAGNSKLGAQLPGQKNFEGFPLINQTGIFDYKHTPKPLREKEFDYPLSEDLVGQRYPGFWIKGKFHYVKEMEPELIVPDLIDFPLKPYVSYRAEEVEHPELTAKTLFNLTYADDVYKRFMAGENLDQEADVPMEEQIIQAEAARNAAEKTGSDKFERDPDHGIAVDRFN